MRIILKKSLPSKKGFTLIEILISLVILSLIIIPLFTIFAHTSLTINKSEKTIDSTYIAQHILEDMYNNSISGKEMPEEEIIKYWDDLAGQYWINRDIKIMNQEKKMVRVIVKVYKDESEQDLKAQMETIFLWN